MGASIISWKNLEMEELDCSSLSGPVLKLDQVLVGSQVRARLLLLTILVLKLTCTVKQQE